jgi:hypothetical protein
MAPRMSMDRSLLLAARIPDRDSEILHRMWRRRQGAVRVALYVDSR